MDNRIEIYSYAKVWRIERKIYSIGNFHLPAPVNPHDLMSFIGVLILMQILCGVVPLLSALPSIVKYFVAPYFISKYLMKKKLDGKSPISYLIGLIVYFFTEAGTYVEIFERYRDKEVTYEHDWICGKRRYQEV